MKGFGGTYALLLSLARCTEIEVGSLGRFPFPKGYYVYLGSALGGLRARLSRHLRRDKMLRWHIDYLAVRGEIVEIWWQVGQEKRECHWAAVVRNAPAASQPVPHFGCSDCRCASHLEHFTVRPPVSILGPEPISVLKLDTAGAVSLQPQLSAIGRQHSATTEEPEPLTLNPEPRTLTHDP